MLNYHTININSSKIFLNFWSFDCLSAQSETQTTILQFVNSKSIKIANIFKIFFLKFTVRNERNVIVWLTPRRVPLHPVFLLNSSYFSQIDVHSLFILNNIFDCSGLGMKVDLLTQIFSLLPHSAKNRDDPLRLVPPLVIWSFHQWGKNARNRGSRPPGRWRDDANRAGVIIVFFPLLFSILLTVRAACHRMGKLFT